ncbi:MAG TPA: undecaprenyldiphospho-muramoylpentapeptide beta-N-acetylglucosaminyltransferase [Acetobacteraceae bacterium]|nr:undecaprenyldiphospho-muramoylpentapeptide beta-N-acetylglucosaminyltransferase [Acetobacteraceae bacterium]
MLNPVVIAAGGTGGHFFPAEALADELQRRGMRVVLMTDSRSGGLNSGVFAGCERHVIAGAGLSGRGIGRASSGVAQLARGTAQARAILARLEPAAIIGFGGYPAVSPVLAGRLLRRRPALILHEQNAVLGRANRLLARIADDLALSFAETSHVPARIATHHTGNPVRRDIASLAGIAYAKPESRLSLLMLGGSLGAKIFASLIPEALALLPEPLRARIDLVAQYRADDIAAANAVLERAGIAHETSSFFTDIPARLATAHLVIARAGASTIAELTAAGRPSILIPLPHAIDDHQRANADALARHNAAIRLDQATTTPELLARAVRTLLEEPARLAAMAAAAARAGRPDAASGLADLVQQRASAETAR